MSNGYIHHKGYSGSIEFSEEDGVFHGKVVGIRALISFEGDSVKSITKDFHQAVNEYLSYCKEKGIEAEKPFKGSFNVRIGGDLHRKAALTARERGISLNAFVEESLKQSIHETL